MPEFYIGRLLYHANLHFFAIYIVDSCCGFYLSLRKAKLLLKKKRFLENLLENTDTQLENLQQMVDTIEFTQIEVKVVEGLKQGNEALNQLHKVHFKCMYWFQAMPVYSQLYSSPKG